MSLNDVRGIFLHITRARSRTHYLFNISRGILAKIVANWLTYTNQIYACWKDKHSHPNDEGRESCRHSMFSVERCQQALFGIYGFVHVLVTTEISQRGTTAQPFLICLSSFFFVEAVSVDEWFLRLKTFFSLLKKCDSLKTDHSWKEMKSVSRRFLCDLFLFCGFVLCCSRALARFVRRVKTQNPETH